MAPLGARPARAFVPRRRSGRNRSPGRESPGAFSFLRESRMARRGDIEMVVVMDTRASQEDIDRVVREVEEVGAQAFVSPGRMRTVIGLVGDTERLMELPLATLPHVEQVIRVGRPYKLVARELHPESSVVGGAGGPRGEGG